MTLVNGQCTTCGLPHKPGEVMTLDGLRRMLAAAGPDMCPTTWGVLNVAQVVITEVDRINAELVALRAQVPRRVRFYIDDTQKDLPLVSVKAVPETKEVTLDIGLKQG